ncbi:unnamed protein product, partial [Larinioides sclopetarius]
KTSCIAGCQFTTFLGNTPENGFNFHLTNLTLPHVVNNLPFGFLCDDSGNLENLKDLDINIKPFDSENPKSSFALHFKTGQNYEVVGTATEPIVFYSGQAWSGFLEMSFIEFTLKGKKGSGIILSGEVYKAPKQPSSPLPSVQFPQTVPLTVQFTDDASHFGEITGGKGSSLGKLTRLSEIEKSFTVPKGIVVTTAAYSEFLNQEILDGVKYLENIVYGKQNGDLKEACNKVSNLVAKAPLPNKICHSIMEDLKDIFGDEITDHKFAVRSSATGEDTAAMSAAGQMDTFLGIQGFKEIFEAVKKCWASQFGHIAVEYKRRNGQILNSPMAVVIQDMVPSEVSGVMFTCDPVSNNPSVITITANYGLGETVVSGSVEPDTFVLKRKEDRKLEIEEVVVGAKHQKMVMQDSGGTATEDIDENSRNEACLSEETVRRLGRLGVKIEKYYKSSRDIEFGIANDQIFILQSRPVTNIAAETDYEILHEFDNALRCENVHYTIANVGEVFPGAASPLAIDLATKYFAVFYERQSLRKGFVENFFKSKYFLTGIQPFSYHMMISAAEIITRYGIDTTRSKGFMISIFGRILTDEGLLNYAYGKYKGDQKPSLKDDLRYYWDLFFYDLGYKKIREAIFNYPLNFLKFDSAKETYQAILDSCSDFDGAVEMHLESSESSSNWNIILFSILCEAKGYIDTDVYSDFAILLASSSNIESANVPQAMQEVALQIVKDIGSEKFCSMSVEEAEEWLLSTQSAAGHQFRQFLERHGHRCLKEFDIRSVTWGSDPKILIKLLQSLAPACKEQPKDEDKSMGKIFSQLHIPLNFLNKCLLRLILPNCRRAIRAREAGKSLTIKIFDHWRKSFRRLGKQMLSEGRLPDEDLIYFLTLDEIKDLLDTRSPSIISRANYRRRIFTIAEDFKFPEISRGFPKPINFDQEKTDSHEYIADLTMKGTPVSLGVSKGYARVAMSLEEASKLKPGEILITYCTDIGWSPYFPIISGVVTELGGLISHGAVVSREYGVPCVVGMQGATKKFRTGDYVLLDGKKGILQRLPLPEE